MLRIIFFLLTLFALVACGDKSGSGAASPFSFASSIVGPADKALEGCEGQVAPSGDSICIRYFGDTMRILVETPEQRAAAREILNVRMREAGEAPIHDNGKGVVLYKDFSKIEPWVLDLSGVPGIVRVTLKSNMRPYLDVEKGKVLAYMSRAEFSDMVDRARSHS